jgi:hypothetical protein
MPGALLLLAGILLYGSDAFGLVELAVVGALHFVIGWFYLVASPLRLPPHPAVSGVKANPFVPPAQAQAPKADQGKDAERESPQRKA